MSDVPKDDPTPQSGLNDLIEALTIFAKYNTNYAPTHCEHDIMMVLVEKDKPTAEERERLDKIGFHWNSAYECWASFRFGSA